MLACPMLLGLAHATPVSASTTDDETTDDEVVSALDLINEMRQSHGLNPLAPSGRLQSAAQLHADDMAEHDFVSHTGSDGVDAIERILRYYPFNSWLGETIGAGFKSGAAVVAGWERSEPHREALMLPDFRAIGLGMAVNTRSRYRWFWTCDLGGEIDIE